MGKYSALHLIIFSAWLSSCNKSDCQENKSSNDQPNVEVRMTKLGTPIKISDVSIEKNISNKYSVLSTDKAEYLIKFKVANISKERIYAVTFPDSSCVYIGAHWWKNGRDRGAFSYNTYFSKQFHKKVYLTRNPLILYLPFDLNPAEEDSINLSNSFWQRNSDSVALESFINFQVISTKKGPALEKWEFK